MEPMENSVCIPIDPSALGVLRALEAAGETAWFVGGCVRDALLGRPAHDFDIATSARWQRVRAIFQAQGRHVIETGAEHGSVGVVVDGMVVETTTYRTESAYSDGRRPDDVAFVDDIALDLARRDFCMNAIAYHPERGLFDPFGGKADIEAGVVRALGDADERFEEDPLRILRAVRFCAQLGFDADERTRDAAVRKAGDIRRIARERVFAELEKTLLAPACGAAIARYRSVVEAAVPGFLQLGGGIGRTARALDSLPTRADLRFAALLAGMEEACGKGTAHDRLRTLRAPRKLIARVNALIAAFDEDCDPVPLQARLLVAAHSGDIAFVRDLITLQTALAIFDDASPERGARMSRILDDLESGPVPLKRADLAIGGGELIEAGMPAGPSIAATLDALLLETIRGDLPNERAALLAWATSGSCPCEPGAGNIFQKSLKKELTKKGKHRNIQTCA